MPAFDLTANITFQAAGLGALNKSIKNQLKIEAPVTLKFDPSSRQNVKALEVQLRSFNKELANVSKNATSAAAAVKQLGQAFSKVGTGVAQAAKTQQSMKKIAQSTQEATSQIEEFGRVSGLALRRNAGFLIATGVVFGFVNAVKTAFSDSIKFERQLVKVAQVTGKTVGSLTSLTKEIRKLSTDLGVSSESLVEVAQTLAQAGLTARQTEQALGALAKTTLAATFGDIADTTEGAIALMAQFGIQAKDLEKALGSVNAVAGAFAVESDDIIAAIKRAGGVFAATSKGVTKGADALNEFIAVFTSVRATTRESAETIATGLRTIFTRIQRPQTIQFLRELGISLTDIKGKFVGPFEAVNRLSEGLAGLDTRNPLFARVIEELGGFRQVGKVIPLLAQTEVRMRALTTAEKGLNSLTADSAQAQQSLAVQIERTRESFLALIRDISQTSTFRAITESILGITNQIIALADAIKPVLPLIAAFGIIKGTSASIQFASGFLGKGVRGKFHSGGLVPGGKGVKDDYPATLQTGEYVIRREAVDAIGVDKLNALNQGRSKFAKGGKATSVSRDLSIGTPDAPLISGLFLQPTQGRGDSVANKALTSGSLKASLVKAGIVDKDFNGKINIPVGKNFVDAAKAKRLNNLTENAVADLTLNTASLFGDKPIDDVDEYLADVGIKDITGKIYEASLAAGLGIKRKGSSARGIDFEGSDIAQLSNVFGNIPSPFADAKLTDTIDSVRSIRDKIITRIGEDPSFLTKYGSRIQRNKGGEVPALLTRGEFVMSKSASKRIGSAGLDALNNADRKRFATGGNVDRSGFFRKPKGTKNIQEEEILRILANQKRSDNRSISSDSSGLFGPTSELGDTSQFGLFGDNLTDSDFQSNIPVGLTRRGGRRNSVAKRLLARARVSLARKLTRGSRSNNIVDAIDSSVVGGDTGGTIGALGASSIADTGVNEQRKNTFRQSLGKVLRRGSISGAGGLRGLAKTTSGLRAVGATIGVAGAIGGQAVGQAVGGPEGAAITGAASGAALGSIAGPFGAAIGGVIGGIKGFIDAKLDAKVQKSTEALIDSLTKVDEAFQGFEDLNINDVISGLPKLRKSFQGLTNDIATKAVDTNAQNALGITSKFGTLFKAAFTSDTFGDLTRQQGQEIRNNTFKDIKSESAASGANTEKLVTKLVANGDTLDSALSKIGTDAKVALAIKSIDKTAGKEQNSKNFANVLATGNQVNIEKFADNILKTKAVSSSLRQAAADEAKAKELARAIEAANVSTDKLADRMNDLSAVLDDVGKSGETARRANVALLSRRSGGAGIATRQVKNVFANTRANSLTDINAQADKINSVLGNTKGSKEFTNALKGVNLVQRNLPKVLGDLNSKLKTFDSKQIGETSLIEQSVSQNFGSIPKELQDKLKGDIRSTFLNRLSSPDQIGQEANAGGLTEFADKFAQAVNEVGKKFVDTFNKNIAEYETVLNTWVGLNAEANSSLDKFVSLQTENALNLKQLSGKRLTAQDLGAANNAQIGAFAQRAGLGAGPVSVGSIAQQERALSATIGRIANNNGDGSSLDGDPAAISEAMTKLSVQQQNAVAALKAIVENTAESAALQSELNGIIDARGQARGILEDIQFGTPQEKQQISRQIGLATTLKNGGTVLPSQLADAREGQRKLGIFAAAQGPDAADAFDKQRLTQTANNSDVQRFFGLTQKAGLNQGTNVNDFLTLNDANARNRRAEINNIEQGRIAAQGALANIDRRDSNQFLQTGRETFDKSQQDLFGADSFLTRLNDALAAVKIPEKIEVGGALNISLTLNGGVEAQIGPEIEKQINARVQEAIKKHLPPDGPSSRRA